jgi:hypothetical protein
MSNPQVPVSGSIGAAGPFPTLGATTITLADANHVLADPSETCYQYLFIGGAQTAERAITAPLVKGFTYLVVNETTGGFAVNIGGASGDTVSVPVSATGEGTWVSCDGTNYASDAGGPGSAGYVIFRPGVASTGQAVETPAEILTAYANGAQTFFVDSSSGAATLPTGFVLPYFAGGVIGYRGLSGGFPGADLLTLTDTAQMTEAAYFQTIKVVFDCNTTPGLTTAESFKLIRVVSAVLAMGASAGVPALTVTEILGVFAQFASGLNGITATALFGVASGGTLEVEGYDATAIAANATSGVSGSSIVGVFDASSTVGVPTTAGTFTPSPVDSNQATTYGSGTAFPTVNAGGQALRVGQPFFRTDLDNLFTWNGTTWVAGAASLVAGQSGYVIYRPGVASAGQAVETEAELPTAIANGAQKIFVDSSVAPAQLSAGNVALLGFVELAGYNNAFLGAPSQDLLTALDGATISDCRGIAEVSCTCTTTSVFTFTSGLTGGQPCMNVDQASITSPSGAAVPACVVAAGVVLNLVCSRGATFVGGTATALFTAASGGFLTVDAGFQTSANGTAFGSEVGGQLIYAFDASSEPPAFTFALGTYIPRQTDQAIAIGYSPATLANWSGTAPTSVANALDRIAAKITPIP